MNELVLYFENRFEERRIIGKTTDENGIAKLIKDFLDDHNYKSYYTRTWVSETNPNEKIYDVGSHSEFFICYNPKGWC
jgi:hypothetical protein